MPEADPSSPEEPMPKRLRWAVAAIFATIVLAGWITRDFGNHWDEKYQVAMVSRTVETGVFLPHWYRYPSVTYWLSLTSLAPFAIAHDFDSAALLEEVNGQEFKLRGRLLFIPASYLAIFWVALLAWRTTRSPPVVLLGAAILALNFEFHYHSRWMVSDTVMAQFVVLGTLLAVRYLQTGRTSDFVWTAVVAGVSAGTKYPGGLVLLPLGLALLYRQRRIDRVFLYCLVSVAIVAAVFLLTTPGAVLDWEQFRKHIEFEWRHYRVRGQGVYTIEPGLAHLSSIASYLGFSALSFNPFVALGGSVLALLGMLSLWRRDWRPASMLIFFPLAYVLYFSSQRAMLVRNLQLMQPFLALFAACGAVACVRGVWPRRIVAGVLVLGLVWNAIWLVRADASILGRERIDWQAQVTRFCTQQEQPVLLGKGLRAKLGVDCVGPLIAAGLVTMDAAQAGRVVLYPEDIELPNREAYERFIANVRGTYQLLPAGPWEVHWDYYPTWAGDPRPIVISGEYYRNLVARP